MEKGYLYQVLPFLSELNKNRRQKIVEYFITAPVWLMDTFEIVTIPSDKVILHENGEVDNVYIIAKGIVKATDLRVTGIEYEYTHFDGIYAMGGLEVLINERYYRTTLVALTDCLLIKIPVKEFTRWINNDIKALKQEAKATCNFLLETDRRGRTLLFMDGRERLCYLLSQKYREEQHNGVLKIYETRDQLATISGLSVKTINRSVLKLEKEGLLIREGKKIVIDGNQYDKMCDVVSEKFYV